MSSNLSKEELEKLSVVKRWEGVCESMLSFHRQIRNGFWLAVQVEGPDCSIANSFCFSTIEIIEKIDREIKILLRKIKIIKDLCNKKRSKEEKILVFDDFFEIRKKYMDKWDKYNKRINKLSEQLPDESDYYDMGSDF